MSDFQDFLRNKTAYVAVGEFKPGKFSEAKQLYAEAVSTYGAGFEGAYLLQEPGTDRGIAVIFWDDASDMTDNNQDEIHQAILKKMNPLFATKPDTSFYEVVCDIQPEDLPSKTA
jgi:heme-degrading monooxygenase HmoA